MAAVNLAGEQSTKHIQLPPVSSVENGSVERGQLDTWPVKPTIDKRLSSTATGPTSTSLLKPMVVPKPKFLEQLEGYLTKELHLLGCPPTGPNNLRLQAHREVFEMLIQDFRTYKPLLSAIKNEYDLYVEHLEDIIRELLPLKTKLHFLEHENEKKLMELKEKEKKEDRKVQVECRQLKQKVIQMNNDHLSFKAQITKLQDELGIAYDNYRKEADARKLLIADITDMKGRQNEQRELEAGGGASDEYEDPVILKLKLTRAKEDLKNSNQRINQMIADYGDVVSRREFEELQASSNIAESELESIKTQYATLLQEHDALLSMHKDAETQKERFKKELERMKGTATPRPEWERCGEFIDGGPAKWAELSEDRSSDELVDILCAQIAGIDITELTYGTFKGRGMSNDVPRFLRSNNPVNNRRMSRSEMEDIVAGFWEHRSLKMGEAQQQGTEIQPLDVLLYEYLLIRADGKEEKAIESGYNFNECCGKFRHLVHIDVFVKILFGDVEEEVFDGWISTQVALVEKFKEIMEKQEILPIDKFEEGVHNVLPYKDEPFISALIQCAKETAKDEENNSISIIKLLDKGSHKEPSDFAVMLLDQRREETRVYAGQISKLLGQKEAVSLSEAIKAVKEHDPHKSSPEIYLLMSRLYQIPLGKVKDRGDLALSKTELLVNLEATNTALSTP